MTEIIELNADEEFLFSEAQGTRSRKTVTLAQSVTVYHPGDVVIATGANGSYVLATNTLIDANASAAVAIVCRKTSAVSGAKKAAVIYKDAEVKAGNLTFGAATVLADVIDVLAAQGITVLPDASA